MKHVVSCTSGTHQAHCIEGKCAERRLLEQLCRQAHIAGFCGTSGVRWVNRHTRAFVIERLTKDGMPACSLPCLLCRRAMDTYGIRWVAHLDAHNVVTEQDAPPSKFTHRQQAIVNGTFG